MGVRYGVALIVAAVAGAAMAAIAGGQEPPAYPGTTVPSNERTDPQIHPASGSPLTAFTLTFILRDAPGHKASWRPNIERR